MSEKDYLQDISEIKNMMNRSSRFLSLSGLSGILAGIYALIGAFFANKLLIEYVNTRDINVYNDEMGLALTFVQFKFIAIALTVAFLSIVTAFILTKQKAKRQGVKIWDTTSKRLLFSFLIPLITGGVFALITINKGFYGFVAPATLIFYGLALVNASKFTVGNVKYLGIAQIILGLIAMQIIGYGLYFWAVGFGILHILYGAVMYVKEKK
jgi:hypothetical protein